MKCYPHRKNSVTPITTPVKRDRDGRGISLIETMMAAGILLIAVGGLLNLFTLAVTQNSQQGNTATRTTEYAQDKLEQLMKLDFADGTTDTTVTPVSATGGTGLGGVMAGNTTLGSIPPAAPVALYADYFDNQGNRVTSALQASFIRQWSISTNATATLKTLTVVVSSQVAGNQPGAVASTTLFCIRSSGL
jgi:hypothetical protein